jgi:hypothetical protein
MFQENTWQCSNQFESLDIFVVHMKPRYAVLSLNMDCKLQIPKYFLLLVL